MIAEQCDTTMTDAATETNEMKTTKDSNCTMKSKGR